MTSIEQMSPVLGEKRTELAKRLSAVAMSTAFLVQERVITEENYEKCLTTWLKKHAPGDAVLRAIASMGLSFKQASAQLPPLK